MVSSGAIVAVFVALIASYFAYEWHANSSKVSSVVVLALNFLARPHVTQDINYVHMETHVASAWNGSYLSQHPEMWIDTLNEEDKESLHQAVLHFQGVNKSMNMMTVSDFPISMSLKGKIAEWDYQLRSNGRGFQVIRGLPVRRWTTEQAEICFFALGLFLGIPGAQDIQGSLLGHVKDIGQSNVTERPYRQADNIAYHCDGSDIVGLMCIHPAKKGGASRIISSVTVYNQLLHQPEPSNAASDPVVTATIVGAAGTTTTSNNNSSTTEGQRIVRRLFQKMLIYTRKTFGVATHMPIAPMRQDRDGVIRTYWNQDYYRKAYKHDNGTLTRMGEEVEEEHRREMQKQELINSQMTSDISSHSPVRSQSAVIAAIEAYDAILVEDNERKRRNQDRVDERLRQQFTGVNDSSIESSSVSDREQNESLRSQMWAILEAEGALELELGLDMQLQQGDIQLVANHFVLHARTAFTDYSQDELDQHRGSDANMVSSNQQLIASIGKRDLLRLWLSHSDVNMSWRLYMDKQLDYIRVLAGLLEGIVKYR